MQFWCILYIFVFKTLLRSGKTGWNVDSGKLRITFFKPKVRTHHFNYYHYYLFNKAGKAIRICRALHVHRNYRGPLVIFLRIYFPKVDTYIAAKVVYKASVTAFGSQVWRWVWKIACFCLKYGLDLKHRAAPPPARNPWSTPLGNRTGCWVHREMQNNCLTTIELSENWCFPKVDGV